MLLMSNFKRKGFYWGKKLDYSIYTKIYLPTVSYLFLKYLN